MAKKLTVTVLVLGSISLMAPARTYAGWKQGGVSADRNGRGVIIERREMVAMAVGIEEAQGELTPQVMSLPGVVGITIGECEGKPCIKVLVASKTKELLGRIPSTYRGYKVAVDEVGEIRGPRPVR